MKDIYIEESGARGMGVLVAQVALVWERGLEWVRRGLAAPWVAVINVLGHASRSVGRWGDSLCTN